jgi:hypothetical protein
MIRSTILDSDFNIQFPYAMFPWRLEVNKDCHNVKGIALTVCHFECEEHLQKYLDRYKLKPKDYQVLNRDGKSLKSSKKHKKDISKRSGRSNNGSSSTSTRRASRVDSVRNTVSSTKRKK